MGILDWLGVGSGKPTEKSIRRAVKTLTHKYVDPSKRWAAAEQLSQWGTPEAIYGLLQRFTMNAPSATIDDDEKKAVCDLVCSLGEKAVAPILRFLAEKEEVAWPLTAMEKLLPEDQVVGHILDVLDHVEITFARDSSKKVELLNKLKEASDERIAPHVERFLSDTDDEVVITAIDLLLPGIDDAMRDRLWDMFSSEMDRPRVKLKILELFASKEWKIKGADKAEIKKDLPPGYYITKKGLVKKTPG